MPSKYFANAKSCNTAILAFTIMNAIETLTYSEIFK